MKRICILFFIFSIFHFNAFGKKNFSSDIQKPSLFNPIEIPVKQIQEITASLYPSLNISPYYFRQTTNLYKQILPVSKIPNKYLIITHNKKPSLILNPLWPLYINKLRQKKQIKLKGGKILLKKNGTLVFTKKHSYKSKTPHLSALSELLDIKPTHFPNIAKNTFSLLKILSNKNTQAYLAMHGINPFTRKDVKRIHRLYNKALKNRSSRKGISKMINRYFNHPRPISFRKHKNYELSFFGYTAANFAQLLSSKKIKTALKNKIPNKEVPKVIHSFESIIDKIKHANSSNNAKRMRDGFIYQKALQYGQTPLYVTRRIKNLLEKNTPSSIRIAKKLKIEFNLLKLPLKVLYRFSDNSKKSCTKKKILALFHLYKRSIKLKKEIKTEKAITKINPYQLTRLRKKIDNLELDRSETKSNLKINKLTKKIKTLEKKLEKTKAQYEKHKNASEKLATFNEYVYGSFHNNARKLFQKLKQMDFYFFKRECKKTKNFITFIDKTNAYYGTSLLKEWALRAICQYLGLPISKKLKPSYKKLISLKKESKEKLKKISNALKKAKKQNPKEALKKLLKDTNQSCIRKKTTDFIKEVAEESKVPPYLSLPKKPSPKSNPYGKEKPSKRGSMGGR